MASSKPVCKYGSRCYRKSREHLRQFAHPGYQAAAEASNKRGPPKRKQEGDKEDISTTAIPPKKPKLCEVPTASCSVAESPDSHREVRLQPSPSSSPADTAATKQESSEISGAKADRVVKQVATKEGDNFHLIREAGIPDKEELDRDRQSTDVREKVRRKFLVDMPEDFYQFWDLCKSLSPEKPEAALVPALGLELVGPYHVLARKLDGVPWQKCVLHFRFFYDPPEMVTVARRTSDSDKFHLGYFRDDPRVGTAFIVSNDASAGCEIRLEAENMFTAIKHQIETSMKVASTSRGQKKQMELLKHQLEVQMRGLGLQPTDHRALVKKRHRAVVAECLHKIGIVVPYDKKADVGYRPLPMTNRELLKLLNNISNCPDPHKRDRLFEPLQEIITFVQFANDECDYGMGLELGLDLFSHGEHFHRVVSHLLMVAYDLLQREEYGQRLEQHLAHRSHTPLDLSSSPASPPSRK